MSQIYEAAAWTLRQLERKAGSLKQLCFQINRFARPVYALLIKLLEVKEELDARLWERWPECPDRALALVMLFDYLSGGRIRSGGRLKHEIVTRFSSLPKLPKPTHQDQWKWVRVNQFLSSTEELKTMFNAEEDDLIPGLFRVRAELVEKHANSKKFIVQDKASAMSVAALRLRPGNWSAFDACSAPGNKTLQLSGSMRSLTSGRLFAYEQKESRFEVLESRLQSHCATNVVPVWADFLQIKTVSPRVKFGIVDPSCSGSGIMEHHMVDSGRFKYSSSDPSYRIRNLAKFQKKVLKHALLLGNLEEVVYSTCSLYQEENEEVVRDTLKDLKRFYKLRRALPSWPRRGINLPDFSGASCCRTHPVEDKLTGFFVALFHRRHNRLRHKLLDRRTLTFTLLRNKYMHPRRRVYESRKKT